MPEPATTEELNELDFERQGQPPETAVSAAGVPSEPPEDRGWTPDASGLGVASPESPAEDGESTQLEDLDDEELAELGLSRDDLADEAKVYQALAQAGYEAREEVEEPLTLEDIQEWVERSPFEAAQWLANYQTALAAQQLRAEDERLRAPLIAKHNTDTARETLETLHSEFGKDVVDLHKDTLAAAITQASERGDAMLLNPETRVERLREVIRAAEHGRLVAYMRGDDVKDEIDRFEAHDDAFGTAWTPKPPAQEPSLVPPAAAQLATEAQPGEQARDAQTGRFVRLQDGTYRQVEERPGPVHVEGASHMAQPPSPPPVDPEIAAIDELDAKRDVFGRSPGW